MQVVVTNQITTRFVGAGSGAGNALKGVEALQDVDGADAEPEEEDGSHVTAALGNTWSHAVNTRLIVQYLDDKFRQVKIERNSRFFFYGIQHLRISLVNRHRLPLKIVHNLP